MHEKTLIKVYSEKYNIEGLIEDYGIVVNTDETVHTARSRSAFVPVNRARRQNEYHMLKSCVNGMASGGINAPLTQLLRYDLS